MPYTPNLSNLLSGLVPVPTQPLDSNGILVEPGQTVRFPKWRAFVESEDIVTGTPYWDEYLNVWLVSTKYGERAWDMLHPCTVVRNGSKTMPTSTDSDEFVRGFAAGVAALREKLLTLKYDALKEGRLDLERFDIRSVEP